MSSLHPGDIVENRYRIGARIARGGMSTVYTAVDTRLDREVAVKVMDANLAGERTFRTRFEREARAVAKLNHPALVNVFDQGVDGDLVFLVMELVVGGSLRELLKERGPMPPHAALAVMEPVLKALSVAHATGMVHRDIKPDNVLISDTHQVKLADFGLVRAIASGASASAPTSADGTVIGTVGYLSPEQIRGESLDQRSDVYSAGILLYELITGTTPFREDTPVATAMARLHRDVPAPSSVIGGVPPEIDELVATATARDPQKRYADGEEFHQAVAHTARILNLPLFNVPSPEDSAVRRALAGADFGERLSWDDDSMSTRAVDLEHAGENPTAEDPYHRSQMTAHTQLQPEQALPPGYERPPLNAHSPAAAYPTQTRRPAEPPSGAPMHHAAGGALLTSNGRHVDKPAMTNRSTGRTVLWVLVLIALVASVAIGGWWFTSGRYGEIPNVVGMNQATAQATVEEAGFTSGLEERYSDEDARQQVMGTDPPFGERAPRGSQVAVLVSLGKPTVPQPGPADDVATYSERLAERTLSSSLGEEVYSNDVPEGRIAETTPAFGTEVNTNTTITVHLSKGPRPVTVPKVEGQTQQRAERTLENAGLKVAEIVKEFSKDVEGGKAIGTRPGDGEEVPGGSEITLVISSAIEVPDVTGMSENAARAALRDAGLNPVDGDGIADRSVDAGDVAAQSPEAGTLIDPAEDTNVTIQVSTTQRLPFLLGQTAVEAKRKLEDMGLEVIIDGPADGRVYNTSPSAIAWVSKGDTVTLRTF